MACISAGPTGREHRVPLSTRVRAVLGQARDLAGGSGFGFPSARGGPLSEVAISTLVRHLKIGAVPHGFRFELLLPPLPLLRLPLLFLQYSPLRFHDPLPNLCCGSEARSLGRRYSFAPQAGHHLQRAASMLSGVSSRRYSGRCRAGLFRRSGCALCSIGCPVAGIAAATGCWSAKVQKRRTPGAAQAGSRPRGLGHDLRRADRPDLETVVHRRDSKAVLEEDPTFRQGTLHFCALVEARNPRLTTSSQVLRQRGAPAGRVSHGLESKSPDGTAWTARWHQLPSCCSANG